MADYFNFIRSLEKKKTSGTPEAKPVESSTPTQASPTATSSPPSTSFPAETSQQRAPSQSSAALRAKQPLKFGHSPLDWGKLKSSSTNLKGTYTPGMKLTLAEVAKHSKEDDAWTVLRGKVYNITPYIPFHPGGAAQLMRAAGNDGTKLFMSIHSWVNIDMLLDKCLLGPLVNE